MARFCFVSVAQPGHLDFGGMSYARTAVELKNRGHEVRWVMSRSRRKSHFTRAGNILEDFGIHTKKFAELYAGINQKSEDLRVNTEKFAQYLKSHQYDCVVVDRWCTAAAYSAHLAGLPWATAGTDGRKWTLKRVRLLVNKGVFPGLWEASPMNTMLRNFDRDDFPRPGHNSFWATSPFLNISFFPRAYYQVSEDLEHPKHSHFVGCGGAPEPLAEHNYLLVTFGNFFEHSLRRKLVKTLRPLIRELSINVLFLAGNIDVANALRQIFRNDSGVEVKEWMPYDRAYRRAMGVIGHGGTSHIWYGWREGKPLLALPFMADQLYGALQIERFNAGRSMIPIVVPWLLPSLLRKLGLDIPDKISVHLNKRQLLRKLHELLTDVSIRDSSIRLSRLMRAGGGVQASASLLENLARFREPVSTCVSPSCCC